MDPSQICHETLLGKFIRLPFRLLPPGAEVRVIRGPARGRRWIADSTTHGFWLGYWELEDQRRFADHLRPGNVVFDIGAHVGLYTLISSGRVGPGGHVYAFEPSLRNVEFLRRHIQINGLANCTVVNAAVSSSEGWSHFEPTSLNQAGHLSEAGNISVATVSLDGFVFGSGGNRPPNAMKIDAEGAEMDILLGGRRTIAEFTPLVFLSTHSEQIDQQCREFLLSAGYNIKRLGVDRIWAAKRGRT